MTVCLLRTRMANFCRVNKPNESELDARLRDHELNSISILSQMTRTMMYHCHFGHKDYLLRESLSLLLLLILLNSLTWTLNAERLAIIFSHFLWFRRTCLTILDYARQTIDTVSKKCALFWMAMDPIETDSAEGVQVHGVTLIAHAICG